MNKLAPKSANALLIEAAQLRPEYQEIQRFMGKRMPNVSYGWLPEAVSGRFSKNTAFGNELPPEGQIEISSEYLSPRFTPNSAVPTLTHEAVHATQGPLADLYYGNYRKPQTPEMRQFVDAYNRLSFTSGREGLAAYPQSQTSVKIGGLDWHNKNARYRTSETELPAQAIGNAMRPDSRGPAHLDPTLATEYRVLLDLANRAQESIRKN